MVKMRITAPKRYFVMETVNSAMYSAVNWVCDYVLPTVGLLVALVLAAVVATVVVQLVRAAR